MERLLHGADAPAQVRTENGGAERNILGLPFDYSTGAKAHVDGSVSTPLLFGERKINSERVTGVINLIFIT